MYHRDVELYECEELDNLMSHTNDLGRDEIPSLVVRLAIPTMLAQLVNVLYSIVDRMYIGHIAFVPRTENIVFPCTELVFAQCVL